MELQAEAERRKRAQVRPCAAPRWLHAGCMRYPGPEGASGTPLAACVSPALLRRAQILESEGQRQSKINVAEGRKVEVVLASEGAREDAINRATGAPCCLHCRVCLPGYIRPTTGPSKAW